MTYVKRVFIIMHRDCAFETEWFPHSFYVNIHVANRHLLKQKEFDKQNGLKYDYYILGDILNEDES